MRIFEIIFLICVLSYKITFCLFFMKKNFKTNCYFEIKDKKENLTDYPTFFKMANNFFKLKRLDFFL